jgi:hypothetical protein
MASFRFDNPFHDLWVTEILDPKAYVRMFSPLLVSDAEELFSITNVVVKGRQGSGKSMLLNLLETSTRIAYANSDTKYPVPPRQRAFISAGVQLTRQNASLVAARSDEIPLEQRTQIIAANFSDYLNCLLCIDLLKNLTLLAVAQGENPDIIPEVPVKFDIGTQSKLFEKLLSSANWEGFISARCRSIECAIGDIDGRLRAHRNYFNYNIEELPPNITSSRRPIGEPMAELASALREVGMLPMETTVLLRIDQHEELFELERHSKLGNVFRQIINSALARRDPRVAYRVGTRHYAWSADVTAWGSGAPLEEMRDYSVIDLDQILKRGEHIKGWKFPEFANDVIDKRLTAAGYSYTGSAIGSLFGRSLLPAARARLYVGGASDILKYENFWSKEWIAYLQGLWDEGEPLEAKFGEAWLRQRNQVKAGTARSTSIPKLPWRESPWWTKERNEIALMQLAGDRRQALVWSGERQIIDLAGHNILALMTICKTIWATWQRRNPTEEANRTNLPTFSTDDQAMGILEASQLWFKKIQVGLEADQRSRFVSALGRWFRRQMLNDRALSNPGHCGFSLLETELASVGAVVEIIKACRDHGDLLESLHTTKNKDQGRRLKWHLHPLLCPLFRIPYIRTKEPIYTTVEELQRLYNDQRRVGVVADEALESTSQQLGLPGI